MRTLKHWKMEEIPDIAFDGLTGTEYRVYRKAIYSGKDTYYMDNLQKFLDYVNELERIVYENAESDYIQTVRDTSMYGQ